MRSPALSIVLDLRYECGLSLTFWRRLPIRQALARVTNMTSTLRVRAVYGGFHDFLMPTLKHGVDYIIREGWRGLHHPQALEGQHYPRSHPPLSCTCG